jgi:hypothetical protein
LALPGSFLWHATLNLILANLNHITNLGLAEPSGTNSDCPICFRSLMRYRNRARNLLLLKLIHYPLHHQNVVIMDDVVPPPRCRCP